MASIYCCKECGANLNLDTANLYPKDFYFEAGNKGTLSFSSIDSSKFRFEKEDKIRPFFETLDYWGIQRKRTKIKCNSCGKLVGYIYDDGQPLTDSPGQFHFGPSQVVPRAPSILIMKHMQMISDIECAKVKKAIPQPPLPMPPLPRYLGVKKRTVKSPVALSQTKKEIADYWRQKQIVEEEHLLAAIKAAARIRARKFSEEDYKEFFEKDDNNKNEVSNDTSEEKVQNKEIRVGVKDWWTKSKYAYLNQPAINAEKPRKKSTYIPQMFCYKVAPPPATNYGIFYAM